MRFTRLRVAGLIGGILVFLLLALLDTPLKHISGYGNRPAYAAGVTALMAIWWLTEVFPIHITACVPLILFPLTGVFGEGITLNARETVTPYVDPYIFLFAGGMCIAASMQQWDLHRRIALSIMRIIGTNPLYLLLGFLAATAFISMWISNTATATMMVPIGIAVILQLENQRGRGRLRHYGMAVMLAIAYGANVGGIGTKIGTAPNAQFSGFMERVGVSISFLQFMTVGIPFVILFLPVIWGVLWRVGRLDAIDSHVGASVVAEEKARLGVVKRPEIVVLIVFLVTAALWVAGKPITDYLKPRVTAFSVTSAHVEGGIAVLAATTLLILRVSRRQVLEFRSLRLVPWSTLLLLGGSFAMASGIQQSGLSEWMGKQLYGVRGLEPYWQVALASVSTVGMSAIASNTATIAIMLNVLYEAVSPSIATTALFAATIAASCDFALPVGTPPNAIVFGSGYVTIPRMARVGVLLDIAAALVAAFWCLLIVRVVV